MAKKTVADVPHMLKMWDRELNNENPEDVPVNCKDHKYWKCPVCGYSWSTSPKWRNESSGKCPCHEANMVIKKGVNDILTKVMGLEALLDENNDFEEIYKQGLNSSLPVNFKCDKCGRKWNATLLSQVKKDGNGGYIAFGCSHKNFTIRKKTEVPFCTEVESIIRFWDENNPMDPAKTKSNSTDRVHFICKNCGYEWTTEIRTQGRRKENEKCKCCERHLVLRKGFTDVFTLIPDSERYFDFNKNKGIDIYSIHLSDSKTKIDWKCPKCGKEWKAYLADRINGKKGSYSFVGCQDCYLQSKERITPVASIPKLLKQWDFKKNKARGLDPNITSAYEDTPADWKCKKCGYEWETHIKTRTNSDGKCPFCESKSKPVRKGVTDVLTLCPDLKEIYDFDYNEKIGIDVYKEGVHSRKRAHFKCKKCGHEWDSYIENRVKKNDDGTYTIADCPECSNGNYRTIPFSIEFPLLAKMYRYDINPIPLDSIKGRKAVVETSYYWTCLVCGEIFDSTLESMLNSQKYQTKGCPFCARARLRKGESFADLHPELMDEYDPTNAIDPYTVFPSNKEPVSWICRDCGHKWSASFAQRHFGGGICPTCNRMILIPDKNSFAAVYPDYSQYWADTNKRKSNEVYFNSTDWFRFICPTCQQEHGGRIEDFIAGNSCPYCKGIRLSPETNSLKALYPDIARRWSPNNSFGPETVFPTSWVSAKWICDTCTGEYGARVREVVNGTHECCYCKGTKILPGFNSFADKHPDLLAEMDEIANYLLPYSPYKVSASSNYKFWFNCKNDPKHKYPMSPRTRLMFEKRHREPCLYCRGKRRKLNHFVPYEKNIKTKEKP